MAPETVLTRMQVFVSLELHARQSLAMHILDAESIVAFDHGVAANGDSGSV